MKWFFLGIVTTLAVLAGGAYLFVKTGGISMDTAAPPLPLEKTVAEMALRASLGHAADQKNPLPFSDDTMLPAAQKYKQYCAVCHGTPGQPATPNLKRDVPGSTAIFRRARHDDGRQGRRNILEGDAWHSAVRHARISQHVVGHRTLAADNACGTSR
jgi:hypothetical protein